MKTVKTHIEWDDEVTFKVYGYKTREEYYQKASCWDQIPKITVPTFILLSLDDTILGINHLDQDVCTNNPNVMLGVTKRGGHLGYFESVFATEQWLVKPVFEFLKSQMD